MQKDPCLYRQQNFCFCFFIFRNTPIPPFWLVPGNSINSSFIWDFWALPFHCATQWTSPSCHEQSSQGRSEGASSVAFEVLIVKSEIDFINLFIFNCLTSNINLFIFSCLTSNINLFNFNCLTSNFCFPKNIFFVYGRGSLVSGFQLNQENDDLLSSGHK